MSIEIISNKVQFMKISYKNQVQTVFNLFLSLSLCVSKEVTLLLFQINFECINQIDIRFSFNSANDLFQNFVFTLVSYSGIFFLEILLYFANVCTL